MRFASQLVGITTGEPSSNWFTHVPAELGRAMCFDSSYLCADNLHYVKYQSAYRIRRAIRGAAVLCPARCLNEGPGPIRWDLIAQQYDQMIKYDTTERPRSVRRRLYRLKNMDSRRPGVTAPQRGQIVASGRLCVSEFGTLGHADAVHVQFPPQPPRHGANPVAPAPGLASLAMHVRTVSGAATTNRATAEVDVGFVPACAVLARASESIFD